MIYKTLLNASLIFLMLCVIHLSAGDKAMAKKGAMLQATATEVEQLDRSQWVWRNMFNNNSGASSTRLLENDDPAGGKSCYIADDFRVGADSTWLVDTLRTYLFWNRRPPDYIHEIGIAHV